MLNGRPKAFKSAAMILFALSTMSDFGGHSTTRISLFNSLPWLEYAQSIPMHRSHFGTLSELRPLSHTLSPLRFRDRDCILVNYA